jgi:hypothetical protein
MLPTGVQHIDIDGINHWSSFTADQARTPRYWRTVSARIWPGRSGHRPVRVQGPMAVCPPQSAVGQLPDEVVYLIGCQAGQILDARWSACAGHVGPHNHGDLLAAGRRVHSGRITTRSSPAAPVPSTPVS